MQAAREEEERALRETSRRAEEDAARQRQLDRAVERERERAEEQRRREKYGHLSYNDPAYARQESAGGPGSAPGFGRAGEPPTSAPGYRGYSVPAPPERNSSFDTNHLNGPPSRSTSATGFRPSTGGAGVPPAGGAQDPMGPYGAKKSVSFDSNLTTEIQTHPYPSTSSEGSLGFSLPVGGATDPPGDRPSPPGSSGAPSSGAQPTYIYTRGSSSGGSSVSDPPLPPLTQPPGGPTSAYFQRGTSAPYTPTTPNEVFDSSAPYRTPESQLLSNQTLVVSSTPGVVGAQEIYRDPRDRIARQKAAAAAGGDGAGGPGGKSPAPIPERMSFRDKMKMFASEIGENTPVERPKISKAQREIESTHNLNGR